MAVPATEKLTCEFNDRVENVARVGGLTGELAEGNNSLCRARDSQNKKGNVEHETKQTKKWFFS